MIPVIKTNIDGIVYASLCPMRYWYHRCTKSVCRMHTPSTALYLSMKYAVRKYYSSWISTGTKPSQDFMNRAISTTYVQEIALPGILDEVMGKARIMVEKFFTTHPSIDPIAVGTSFETPFPIPSPQVVIRDSLDLIFRTSRGHEGLLSIAGATENEFSKLRLAASVVGYQSSRGVSPYIIYSLDAKHGFTQYRPDKRDMEDLTSSVELLTMTHELKNKSLHQGLSCSPCAYKSKCWNIRK